MRYSIVVPVYNVENYLQSCIVSVLAQTHQNYELILVDDGATDTSGVICDLFAQEYPEKIIVLHKANQGALVARQHGINHASGEAIVFLDSDDCLREDALTRIDEVFSQEQCDMVLYNASTEEDYAKSCLPLDFNDGACFTDKAKRGLYEFMIESSSMNTLCTKAIKKNVANNLPEYTQWPRITHGEDLLCSLHLVTNAKKIVYLAQNLYYYRQREDSAVHTFNPKRIDSIKRVHSEFERYIDIWQLPELHQRHYAREVRGWIESLEMLVLNRKEMGRDSYKRLIREMADDPYFRRAYTKMDPVILSGKIRFLAKRLYRRRYLTIRLFVTALYIKGKICRSSAR